ncbi:outer membrane lipoprotein [Pseudomonas sp. M47T1]|uniref:membrane protein n=1 Tax=unclassified Pseudomonas TaxID=196821 RepID=UPI0002606898|nr:membrane protein [Pseudomonas sp. M47T1]EIK94464.1 outer membrane lipoprotein [Pseudomonas sp. M47T1]
MFKQTVAVLSLAAVLAGCQATGEDYQADVFDASQVNTKQPAKTVQILTVSPTKIKVSNASNRQAAQVVGGLLGAVGGGVLGAKHNSDTALVGAVGGGAAGALAGSMVSETSLVPGVLLGYSEDGKIYTSAQVGKPCQFTPGSISLMVMMLNNETRIQPNATCPEPAKG